MSHTKCGQPRIAAAWALAVAATLAGPALAQPAPAYETLLGQALQSPGALEAEALAEAAQGRLRQAGALPNPEVGVEVENFAGGGPYDGFRGAETTVSLSQDLEIWGQRGARVGAARAEVEAAQWRQRASRIDLAARLAVAYGEAEAAQRRFELAEEALALAEEDASAARALVNEGREPELRAIQGESEAAAARASRDEAQAERDAAFAQLAAISGQVGQLTSIDASLLDRAPAPFAGGDIDTPQILAAIAERDAADQRIRAARLDGRPDVRASVGTRRFEEDDATAFTAGVNIEVPFFNRNSGNISAARAELRAAEARLSALRLAVEADRAAARARLTSSVSRLEAADASVVSAAEAYRLTRIGYEAGRLTQLELRSARVALIQAQDAALEARLARVRAEAELARLEARAPYGSAL